MSQNASVATKINLPLVVLWVVSIVAVVGGYLLVITSNASQADLYTAGTADYPALFASQSGASIGTTIIGAGVVGILLALALHARNAAVKATVAATHAVAHHTHDHDDEDFTVAEVEAAERSTPAAAARPVVADAPVISTDAAAAPKIDDTPKN